MIRHVRRAITHRKSIRWHVIARRLKYTNGLPALEAAYDPKSVEDKWYDFWEQKGLFQPVAKVTKPGRSFAMVIPPPNVTGSLHLGHALTISVQDALVRWQRMLRNSGLHSPGGRVVWIPGTDHAGIATQVVVEKQLWKERKVTRHELGREEFIKEVWKWKENYGGQIVQQMRRLGASLDWTRERFTMDEVHSRAVTEAFVRLYEAGKVYRATRLVHWCPYLRSAISDIEVEQLPLEKRTLVSLPGRTRQYEFGVLYRVAYRVVDGGEDELVVATTRPETILGDVAVAVHPHDERYKRFHGKRVVHPFSGQTLPVVVDSQLVDPAVGTGAVKVTPGHDPADFECAKRHGLPVVSILDDDGRVTAAAAGASARGWVGMDRLDIRREVVAALAALGQLRGVHDHAMVLAVCSRSGDVLEPRVKPQWFVACKELAAHAAELARSRRLEIVPAHYEAEWFRWLDGVHDWCISRQLWWGHRIPAYRVGDGDSEQQWIVARSRADAEQRSGGAAVSQDPDVLDTWFSSAVFPLSCLGWPAQTADLQEFYPLAAVETGVDILFFWVARMVMVCCFLAGPDRPPFDRVLLHSMVRDAQGRKMSKSLGNVVDPRHVIDGVALSVMQQRVHEAGLAPKERDRSLAALAREFPTGIPACGADALRFALADYSHQPQINLDVHRVVAVRHLANKLWNAARFVLSHVAPTAVGPLSALPRGAMRLADSWVLSRLMAVVAACNAAMVSFQLSRATAALHHFFLKELCDVYLEWVKPALKPDQDELPKSVVRTVLAHCMGTLLRLLHPFMPFVTEELWQRVRSILPLPWQGMDSIQLADYPVPADYASWNDPSAEHQMSMLLELVHACRSLRDSAAVKDRSKLQWMIYCTDPNISLLLREHQPSLCHLTRAASIQLTESQPSVSGSHIRELAGGKMIVSMCIGA